MEKFKELKEAGKTMIVIFGSGIVAFAVLWLGMALGELIEIFI